LPMLAVIRILWPRRAYNVLTADPYAQNLQSGLTNVLSWQ